MSAWKSDVKLHFKHSTHCFITRRNTSKFRVKPLRVVFSTLFSVFQFGAETLRLMLDMLHKT